MSRLMRAHAGKGYMKKAVFVLLLFLDAVTMTLWETLDTMERSRVSAASARTEAARDAGAEVTSTYELEVGIHSGASDAGKAMTGGHSRM